MKYNKHQIFNLISSKYDFGVKRLILEVVSTLESKYILNSKSNLHFTNNESNLNNILEQIKINVNCKNTKVKSIIFSLCVDYEFNNFQIDIKEV